MSDIPGVADGYIPGQSASGGGLCGQWITADDLRPTDDCESCSGVTADTPSDDVLNNQILAASEYLNAITGFQFPGICESTVRPCNGSEWGGIWAWAPIPFVLPEGVWPFWGAGCGCFGGCECCGPTAFSLGHIPVVSITEVKLDGVVLTEDVDYVVVGDLLARLNPDNPTAPAYWPSCQNIAAPDDEEGTFSVTYAWGASPPALGFLAAADLACVLVKAECGDTACEPVQNMVRRTAGGTTIELISPTGDIRTQLPNSVKMFVDAYGPAVPSMRQPPKLRRPQGGNGYIFTYPTGMGGYGRGGWGGMGGACLGCS
jgi:hypothetical protein